MIEIREALKENIVPLVRPPFRRFPLFKITTIVRRYNLINHQSITGKVRKHEAGVPMANTIPLKDLVPAATNSINTQFIMLEKGNIIQDRKEKMCLSLVADESASVHFQLWGTECEAFEPGDIIRLTQGIFCYHKKSVVLRAGRRGMAEKVGEFTMLFVESPNMSEIEWGPDPSNPKRIIQKSILSQYSRIFPTSS